MKKIYIFFSILTLAVGLAVHNHTNTLEVSKHVIKLDDEKRILKIAHVSDLHTKGFNNLEQQLVRAINENNIDLIVITGDIATPRGTLEGYNNVLKNFKAPKGVYYIPGNWEYWEPIKNLQKILEQNNIVDLTNKTHRIDEHLWLTGFDDSEEGIPNLKMVSNVPENDIKIGLFHSPQFFNKISDRTHLNLAGHSHGGQIRIPFLGSLWTPEGTGDFDQGWFEKDDSKLFVSRGIGTSVLPIRFFCSPELAIIEVHY